MSLARAFTTRRARQEQPAAASYLGRAASQRAPDSKPIKRSEISLPVALISTTNMLSYEAPDIAGTVPVTTRKASSASSVTSGSSDNDSDGSSTSGRSQDTITDVSSVDENSPMSPESNHLSKFFQTSQSSTPSIRSRTNSTANSIGSSRPSMESPRIPQRAPSHSKQAHILSHKRSAQRLGLQEPAIPETSRDSIDMFNAAVSHDQPTPPAAQPFGKELAQLQEVQEEYHTTVRDAEAESDRAVMQSRGLVRFCAADYMQEIASLSNNIFTEDAIFSESRYGWI